MFKKILISAALAFGIAAPAFAGLDMYTSKNFTTLLAPTRIGLTMTGATTNMVTLDGAQTNVMQVTTTVGITTNPATSGVDCVGLPGVGSLLIAIDPGTSTGGVVGVSFSTCATTNGTYVTLTNSDGVASWAATGTATFIRARVRPNSFSRYWRTTVTSTGCTNACVGAILITE